MIGSMDAEPMRRRGRPRGTGLPDRPTLERVADLLVAGKAATKTEAIRLMAGDNPSVVRRLQRKFQAGEKNLLCAAVRRSWTRFPGPPPKPGDRFIRFWDDLPIWNQYGLTIVTTLVVMWIGLEAISIA